MILLKLLFKGDEKKGNKGKNVKISLRNEGLFFALVWGMGVCMRLVLAWDPIQQLSSHLLGYPIAIQTPDAGLYGHYARLLLEGLAHESDVHLIEYVIAFFVWMLPVGLDAVLYFGPAFLAALVSIPIMGLLRMGGVGLLVSGLSGVVGSVGYGFYSRSYLGYFDTDVLNLFFPMMVVWGMVAMVQKKSFVYAYWPAIASMAYVGWYHASLPLLYAMHGFFALYVFVLHRKELFAYQSILLMGCALLTIPWWMSLGVMLVFGIAFWRLPWRVSYFYLLFGGVAVVGLAVVDFSLIGFHLERYAFKAEMFQEGAFWFVSPMQHVSEAKATSWKYIIGLMSGNVAIFVMSLVGYGLFMYRYRAMVLMLPILALGLLSVKAGVRFHIYGVPVLIIGFAYAIWFMLCYVKMQTWIKGMMAVALFVMPVYENYKSLIYWNTKVARGVFNLEQIQALKVLDEKTRPEDFAVSWWDHGWPLWYYARMQTLIDNGRHFADNYTVASIFLSDSPQFANRAIHYFYELYASNPNKDAIVQGLEQDANVTQLFQKIKEGSLELPKQHDKYVVLPLQLLRLGYTMFTFANVDPSSGQKGKSHFFKRYHMVGEDAQYMHFDKGMKFDKQGKRIVFDKGGERPLKRLDRVVFQGSKKLLSAESFHAQGLSLVQFGSDYFLLDDFFYNSMLVQMLVFNHYDANYFEPFYEGQSIAIYKVK